MYVSFCYLTKATFIYQNYFHCIEKNIRGYFANPTHKNSRENSYDLGFNFTSSNRISCITVGWAITKRRIQQISTYLKLTIIYQQQAIRCFAIKLNLPHQRFPVLWQSEDNNKTSQNVTPKGYPRPKRWVVGPNVTKTASFSKLPQYWFADGDYLQ